MKIIGICFLMFTQFSIAQIQIHHRFLTGAFTLNQYYPLHQNDSILVEEFKYYLSDFQLNSFSLALTKEKNVFLVDAEDVTTFIIPIECDQSLKNMRFNVGLDSILNTSQYLEGPFDPLLGMYWAWNTGYIHLKCKGKAVIHGKAIPFEYHIGGYRQPFSTCERLRLNEDSLRIDMSSFLHSLPIESNPRIMLPGKEAQEIHQHFIKCFH